MSPRLLRKVLRATIPVLLLTTTAFAKGPSEYLSDAHDYVLSPLHWDQHDWLMVGEVAAATAAAYTVDAHVRDHFAASHADGDPHSILDSAPLAAMVVGTFAVGLITDNPELRTLSRDMTEAAVFASASAFALKRAFGRTRPNSTADRSSWRSGGNAFPSGHAAAAFAAAQVLADSRPSGQWAIKVAAYALGAFTIYTRLDGNVHWLSDTVAGAGLGIATGRFISSRRRDGGLSAMRLDVQPLKSGALLSVSADPYRLFER